MPLVSDARRIVEAALRSVDPRRRVAAAIEPRGTAIHVGSVTWEPVSAGGIHVLAVGKAASGMFDAARQRLGGLTGESLVIIPRGFRPPRATAQVCYGNHPVPGVGSITAGRAAREFVGRRGPHDCILFLVSGGGSSLCESPVPGVSLRDFVRTGAVLLTSGCSIQETNVIRRHISEVKGGRLAARSGTRRFATLAISDVVGDAPWDIASGPTVPDPTSYIDALNVVKRRGLKGRLPTAVESHLRDGARALFEETPKPRDPRFPFRGFRIIARNRDAVRAACDKAVRFGYRTLSLGSRIVGDTIPEARRLAVRLRAVAEGQGPIRRPACLVSGGETTVFVPKGSGRGGRNQEFALACAEPLRGLDDVLALSVGTDGVDGPTDAAGGWVDGATIERASRLGSPVPEALARHDSYRVLDRLGQLIRTGPTGTNVTDLHIMLAGPARRTAGSNRRDAAHRSRRRRS